jgi:hypothetical protein
VAEEKKKSEEACGVFNLGGKGKAMRWNMCASQAVVCEADAKIGGRAPTRTPVPGTKTTGEKDGENGLHAAVLEREKEGNMTHNDCARFREAARTTNNLVCLRNRKTRSGAFK